MVLGPSANETPARPVRVLVVEDDPGFQLLIQRILERMEPPAEVEIVENADDAVARAGASDLHDLVLLDYSLPGKSGLEVLRELRGGGSGVPVVMVTGMGNEMVAVDALKLGAQDYLVKSGDLKTSLPLVVRRVIEKVRLEDGLRRFSEENERLRELDRLKSQFIANVSHELRTPLVSVIGYTEMLLSEHLGPVSSEQKKALTVCARNSERLRLLIDNILNLTSLEAHRVKPVRRPFDIVALCQKQVTAMTAACAEKGVAIALDAVEPVLTVEADPDLVEQVLWNLLSNAHKFTAKEGTIALTVHREREGRVTVEVRDTGCGIPSEHMPRLFERFWQAEAGPTRRFPGLGIGLAIVKEIMDAHGEPVLVRSVPGEGSTFSFALPEPGGRRDDDRSAIPRKATARALAPDARTVLVVDDEADTREFVKTALEMAGHVVLLADGGREALQILRGTRVHIVLLDVAMREMSGLELLRSIRGIPEIAGVPVLLMTAVVEPRVRKEAVEGGVCGVVEKPVRTSSLLAEIDRHALRESA